MGDCRIVIVGAGQAGANAASELRRRGFPGSVTLVGDERHLPYERPPLSKEALVAPEAARLTLHPSAYYAEQKIELKLGARAVAVDARARRVALSNGDTLAYDKLLLATGAQARRLPALDALGEAVHVLRTLDDARRLRAQVRPGAHALVIGAGVIGLEVASSLVELGATVDVVDSAQRAMSRNAPEIIARQLQTVHEARGVAFHFGACVVDATRTAQGKVGLTLSDGAGLEGDLLIYGVGVTIDGALAESAGLRTVQGAIVIDALGRTSESDIYAAGDAAVQVLADGRSQRLETWENANRQAVVAVCDMLGQPAPAPAVPWFWTDQCGLNVQFAGDMAAPCWVLRGTLDRPPFVAFGMDADGALSAAVCVNQGRDIRPVKDMIAARARLPAAALADLSRSLRDLAKDAQSTRIAAGLHRHA